MLKTLLGSRNYSHLGNITSGLHLSFAGKYRPRRMLRMAEHFGLTEQSRVLDVGGSPVNWGYLELQPRVTILNIGPRPESLPERFDYVDRDARDMPFDDNSFDLCFSNSVIEHIGEVEDRERFASELRRVGQAYYVQTPNYHFPIEPHYIAPFIHWFPPAAQKKMARYLTLWGLTTKPSKEQVERVVDETRLLTRKEMARYFPDADFLDERVLGLNKSLIAVCRNSGGD